MKKLTLLMALFAFVSVGAHAADPAMNRTKIIEKVQATKKRLTPAISKKIKPGMRTVKPGTTEPETTEPETTEPTEPAGTYVLELGEIQFTTDPGACGSKWSSEVTNTGTIASPASAVVSPVIMYELSNGQAKESQMTDYQLPSVAPGQSHSAVGGVLNHLPNLDRIVVSLKDGADVIDSKTAAIPNNDNYTVVLGDIISTDSQFTVSIANEGTDPVPYLTLYFQGITSADPISTFRMTSKTVQCILPGESSLVTIPATTEEHVGYRVMVNEAGQGAYLVMRDYIL